MVERRVRWVLNKILAWMILALPLACTINAMLHYFAGEVNRAIVFVLLAIFFRVDQIAYIIKDKGSNERP